MPTYTYLCPWCGTFSDRIVPIARRNDRVQCPEVHRVSFQEDAVRCQGMLWRAPDAPALRFKGTGFYATDYQRRTK